MTIDAEIKITTNKSTFASGDTLTLPIDQDYAEDFDDVIRDIEDQFWTKYGISMYYNTDFEITNQTDLCDELFNNN